MSRAPEQHASRKAEPKTVAEMSDNEVRQQFEALIAKLDEEQQALADKR